MSEVGQVAAVDVAPDDDGKAPPTPVPPPPLRWFGSLIALVAVGDLLFWGHAPGLSLVVFAAVAAAMIAITARPAQPAERPVLATLALGVAMLPAIEHTQALSFGFLMFGIAGFALLWNGRLAPSILLVLRDILRAFLLGWFWLVADVAAASPIVRAAIRSGFWRSAAATGLLTLVFLGLFALANPLIETWFAALFAFRGDFDPGRAVLWVAIAAVTWPMISASRHLVDRPARSSLPAGTPGSAFDDRHVAGALVVFNLLFAVQTALDGVYLWGQASLPDGMTFAEYAHRGAYPLVATVLLAAGFVIVASHRSEPSPLCRRLIDLWIAQNVLLLASAAMRLDLYVAAYALTVFRMAAFIWMALVATGLGLILVRLHRRKDNGWLVRANGAATAVCLYACCFVNFPAVVADYNVSHSRPIAGDGRALDIGYLCALGPEALPAIRRYRAAGGRETCWPPPKPPDIRNWREWDLRSWRLAAKLADPPHRPPARRILRGGQAP